mmetsp:Transcript_24247/g.37020  ORF Transcript_24247/g.37020 Transcript_24247/m.37020 type:complete len:506 (+) Transcript_24247:108-1625(+)
MIRSSLNSIYHHSCKYSFLIVPILIIIAAIIKYLYLVSFYQGVNRSFAFTIMSPTNSNSCLSTKTCNSSSDLIMKNLTLPDISGFAYNLFALLGTSGSGSGSSGSGNGTSLNLDTYTGPNVLISPFSISSALGLLLAGATLNSTCQEEIQSVLDVNSHLQLPMLTHEVLPTSEHSNGNGNGNGNGTDEHAGAGVKLTSANGIWSRDLRPSYITTITTHHDAVAEPLPATFDPINEYIETQTNGMLPNMLEGDIDPLTVAILVNAVHFKGDWTEQFNASDTEKGIFTTNDGVEQEADFMHASRKIMSVMDVKELDGADMVRLDYGKLDKENNRNAQAEYAALFIKPKDSGKEAMDGLIQSLAKLASGDGISPPTSSLGVIMGDQMSNRRKVNLSLPRFKIEYGTQSIKSHLKTLGMKSIFDDDEVLMEMSSDRLVHLDDVLHKAVMEVTEEGTEAAAATVGIVMTRSMPLPPIDMKFDRPFVMVVAHVDTMTPLFLARVDDPQFSF